jgi:hypothetical protein
MAKRAVDRERHPSPPLEPAAEHQIMLPLVGSVLFDPGDQDMVVRPPLPNRLEDAVDRSVAAMLVVEVDGAKQVKVPLPEPAEHFDFLQRHKKEEALYVLFCSTTALPRRSEGMKQGVGN